MAEDNGTSTQAATGNTGAAAGDGQQTQKTFTEADLQREADRRVTEAQKKWKEQLDATVSDKTRDAEAKLAELATKAEEAERYASFVDAASAKGIRNLKAAYIVAKNLEYFDKKGAFDADRFRKDNPEFFTPTANANAGAGAGSGNGKADMNTWIRQAAGR